MEEERFRDVDVGVYVPDPSIVEDGFTYAFDLSGELERKIGCPVDVLLMNTAPDHLIHSIAKGMVLVDRDEDFRLEWLGCSWKRYLDIQPKRRQALIDMMT